MGSATSRKISDRLGRVKYNVFTYGKNQKSAYSISSCCVGGCCVFWVHCAELVSKPLKKSLSSARRNLRTLLKLATFSVAMFGFGYALIPLYPVVCGALGINQTGVDDRPVNTQVDSSRLVTVEFDTNVHDMAWTFKPLVGHLSVHPGELAQAMFEVTNTRDVPVTGQAIPSYGPPLAAEHFRKLECFCFNKQTLAPGERRQMPVVFVVDSALPKEIATITLSYTFFEVEGNRRAETSSGSVHKVKEGV
ncbi:MAG: cytochrome c oxidase assembly protein [Pseudomonadota bacterium]